LLEVGTGFHPELTGRENILLNGAIMGMSRSEIRRRFDEIVDFSGVEKFIDTPVKRYSSGMYVRLAFSVAAHLDADCIGRGDRLGQLDGNERRRSGRSLGQGLRRRHLGLAHPSAQQVGVDAACHGDRRHRHARLRRGGDRVSLEFITVQSPPAPTAHRMLFDSVHVSTKS
jgi:lipopolysaccharide transport system ATP-binding protein